MEAQISVILDINHLEKHHAKGCKGFRRLRYSPCPERVYNVIKKTDSLDDSAFWGWDSDTWDMWLSARSRGTFSFLQLPWTQKKKELWQHFSYLRCQRVPISLNLLIRSLFSFILISLFCIMGTIPIKCVSPQFLLKKEHKTNLCDIVQRPFVFEDKYWFQDPLAMWSWVSHLMSLNTMFLPTAWV